jgi:hypothetical protein
MIKHDIFLSYAREDGEIVKAIRKSLEIFGFSIWIDEKEIPVGTPSWKKAIQEGIEGASCLVVVLSPDAKNSQWVNEELDYAKTHDRQVFAILAKGDDKKSIPFGFSSHQRVDIRASYIPLVNDLIPAICKALEIHISPKQHYTKKDPKDIRVAQRLDAAITPSILFLASFLSGMGVEPHHNKEKYEEIWTLFATDFVDKDGTERPDPKVLDTIMGNLMNISFFGTSNVNIQEKQLTWYEAFISDLSQTKAMCTEILQFYSDRDDRLISLVENIRQRAQNLIFLLNTNASSESLKDIYESWNNGIPREQYADFVRHYYLAMLKAKRVIREFTNSAPH